MCDEPSAFLGPTPPVLDQDTADRLLAGRLAAGEAPPGYAGVARLLAVATAPVAREELAGEAAAVACFAATVRSHPPTPRSHPATPRSHPATPRSHPHLRTPRWHPPSPIPQRTAMTRKLLSLKAAAAIIVAVVSVSGVAAAATGLLPGPARLMADQASSTSRAGAAGHGQAGTVTRNGPGLDEATRRGLCQAWQAGQGAAKGGRADSAAFRALAAAAGGADKIPAYCQATPLGSTSVLGQSPSADGNGAAPSAPPTSLPPPVSVAPPASGPPPSDGQGDQGQGGPPASTG
jgi:hypothetical protein